MDYYEKFPPFLQQFAFDVCYLPRNFSFGLEHLFKDVMEDDNQEEFYNFDNFNDGLQCEELDEQRRIGSHEILPNTRNKLSNLARCF